MSDTSKPSHYSSCSIYSSMSNGMPDDGICTCGYAHQLKINTSDGSYLKEMYSDERLKITNTVDFSELMNEFINEFTTLPTLFK